MTSTRTAATAAAVEDAALDLVLERGYEHVTVDLICERVGISQRTFFNHFPAKEDAVLGRDMPRVDERAARRFILGGGPILVDAISLIQHSTGESGPRRLAERMRAISRSPALLVRQMERFATIEEELTEIVTLRLQHAHPALSEEARHQRATLITHLLAGLMRWIGSRTDRDATGSVLADTIDQARAILQEILQDSHLGEEAAHSDGTARPRDAAADARRSGSP